MVDNYFYIVQLEPGLIPNRLKMGTTKNVEMRLKVFLLVCPLARLVKCWKISSTHERRIMRLVGEHTKTVGNSREVCDSLIEIDLLVGKVEELILVLSGTTINHNVVLVDKEKAIQSLIKHDFDMNEVGKELGVSRSNIYAKLYRLGIDYHALKFEHNKHKLP